MHFYKSFQMRLFRNLVFTRNLSNFRDSFVSRYGAPESNAWFPGHMYKGVLQMQAKLAVVDCIIEVHDARIPFSGRNPNFYSMLTAVKPHILVLNKCDRIKESDHKKIRDKLMRENNVQNVLFTNCKVMKKTGVHKIVPTIVDIVEMSSNYQKGIAKDYTIMAIGIPNVGKSSLINKLRNIHLKKKNASHVGAVPGITKSVLERIKISESPRVFLYDTPGVMQPKITNVEVGLRLALCRTLRDDLVGESLIADYLLYWLNKNKVFSYVEHFKLEEPIDDIRMVLLHIAKEMNWTHKYRNPNNDMETVPDFRRASMEFVSAFRDGKFGRLLLDSDYLS